MPVEVIKRTVPAKRGAARHGLAAGVVAAALSIGLATPGMSQVADNPEIVAKLQGLGYELSREMVGGTLKTYGPLHGQADRSGLHIDSDLSYGDHELQTLDVYAPEGAEGAPIVIFVHGGGFVRGDKASPDAVGVGPFFAKNGVVGVTMNYRFAPDFTWPSGANDIAMVIDWVKANAASYGGDPEKVVLFGHSAGSMHVADYTFREELQREDDGVVGSIMLSPPTVDLTAREIDPNRDALYYGTDGDRSAQSVVNALDGRKIPVVVAYAEHEPAVIIDQTRLLIEGLAARDGRLPVVMGVPGHNHISVAAHIGTDDVAFAEDLLAFVNYVALD